jgi:hypothetical protein
MSLQRALTELFKVIREEANTNPEFALKLEEALGTYRPSKRAKQRARERASPNTPRPMQPPRPAFEPPSEVPVTIPEEAPPPAGIVHGLNPVSVLSQQGEDALRATLGDDGYSAETLAAIASEHNLNPAGTTADSADKGAWIEQIVAQAKKRVERDSKLFDY